MAGRDRTDLASGLFPATTGTSLSRELVAQDDLEEMILVQTDRTSHNPQVREEALKTLYRLRAEFRERKEPSSSVLRAIESLIARSTRKSAARPGDGSERCLFLTNVWPKTRFSFGQ